MVDIKKQYEDDGYYLAKSVFTNEFCNKLKNSLYKYLINSSLYWNLFK